MKITKKSKASKKIKKESDGDANEGSIKAKNEPMKQGYDIATGVVQDEALHAKYSAMTLDELKQYMKINRMPQSEIGQKNKRINYKKPDFVAHCVDGELWGRYPMCPKCAPKKVTLRVTYKDEHHKGQGRWRCQGYWDKNIGGLVKCSFNYSDDAKNDTPQTRLPWRHPGDEISDDEEDDVNAGMEKPVEFPEDLGTLPPIDMAKKMLEICREHKLTLPQADNDAVRECYTKLQASIDYNDEYDVKTAFNLLKESFPPLTAEEKAGGPAPRNPANAALCAALEAIFAAAKTSPEDPMKAASYRKAAMSIREIDFEVTNGIAISKGKLKVPNVGPSLGAQIQFWIENGRFERMEYYERGEIPPSTKK
ncbi:hypothetical protein BE221DRAFT_78223 [Ostreococcus tauri]|uniref:Crossover junction endonuclease MUS81-like HHH domain-containing protein n=1 Tax=Ostreococcus tauri TaxID=70448 RepID=A0A1Y5I6K5_OSTTA|nr:hypothetical protein BE221DRAFT_78223 [Ostreococcus tauri]